MYLWIAAAAVAVLSAFLAPWVWRRYEAWRAWKHHWSLVRRIRGCLRCACLFQPSDTYYTCGRCADYDWCRACWEKHKADHEHALYEEVLWYERDTSAIEHGSTTAECVDAALRVYSERRLLGTRARRPDGSFATTYSWKSYGDMREMSHSLGAGLRKLMEEHHEVPVGSCGGHPRFVALLSAMCEQWLVADYACLLKAMAVIPMHRSTSGKQLSHMLKKSGARVLVASRHLRRVVLEALRTSCSEESGDATGCRVFVVVWIDDEAEAYDLVEIGGETKVEAGSEVPVVEYSLTEVMSMGKQCPDRHRVYAVGENDLVKLLPTSGSTGFPKLTMVTDRLLRPAARMQQRRRVGQTMVVYAYEMMRQSHDLVSRGGAVGFYSGNLTRLFEDCQALRPTVFGATPTFWNGLYSQFQRELERKARMHTGPDAPSKALMRGELLLEWSEKKLLGNRLSVVISTGAPISHDVQGWIFRVLGCMVVNGYGTTETGGLASNESLSEAADVRLIDCPALGYMTSDKPYPRGEIIAHTARITPGYYNKEREVAANTDDDGDFMTFNGKRYFRTGDIGELRNKNIRVIDRRKSFFKLAQGVFVAPDPLERMAEESVLVSQAFYYGNGCMRSVACVVVPTVLLAERVALERGSEPEDVSIERVCSDASLREIGERIVLAAIHEIGRANECRPWERPSRVLLEHTAFSEWNGLLSSIGKKCRPALIRRYRDELMPSTQNREAPAAEPSTVSTEPPEVNINSLCAGLSEILEDLCPEYSRAFVASDEIDSLGLDSMSLARLSSRIQEQFGCALAPKILVSLRTLGDIQTAIFGGSRALQELLAPHKQARRMDWESEIGSTFNSLHQWHREYRASCALPSDAAEEHVVLVTGATGFLGAFLLANLIRETEGSSREIWCLARASNDELAMDRIRKNLSHYGLNPPLDRVRSVCGRLGDPLLGLEEVLWKDLVTRVRWIYHNAALVNSAQSYERHKSSNVDGTAHVLRVALAAPSRVRFNLVSTMGFMAGEKDETADVSSLPLYGLGGYAQSKYVAERVALACRSLLDLDVVVFRPGVIGPSKNGAFNARDFVHLVLLGVAKEQVVCTTLSTPLPQWFNITAVDFAARSIVKLGEAEKLADGIFHVCSARMLSLKEIVGWMREGGLELRSVGADEFRRIVTKCDESHPWFAFKGALASDGAKWDGESEAPTAPSIQNTINGLSRLGHAAVDTGAESCVTPEGLVSAIIADLERFSA